jgi:hypothetical protein
MLWREGLGTGLALSKPQGKERILIIFLNPYDQFFRPIKRAL